MFELLEQDAAFFELAQRRNLIFYHKGYFSHSIVAAMSEVVKLQLEVAGVSGPTRRKLFSSFIELAQNIVHYSSDSLVEGGSEGGAIREGAVCISTEGERHLMLCMNPIATSAVGQLRERLEPLRNMSLEEIKQAYKLTLRADTPEESKGAGLGFLTMARDASAPLEFAFYPRGDAPETTLFCLKTII
ncbi:SiaB family protein kinase [Paraburkholderia bryophila]|uniref:SiaB family protein kinase n=1 Tax=Paraburkholderia bryophila TaxID=420952 RepID=UPI0023496D85|nr:SiaB family protein kinase [Paraburkholderia bryophila]WCM23576.1 SiaB family protein kinase [Paraburkholderia bryophila]